MTELITDQNNQRKSSPFNIAYKWGLIACAYYILKMYVIYYMDPENFNPQSGGLVAGLIDLAVSLVVMFLANKEYRDKYNGGFLKFGEGFKTSFLTGLVITAIISIFMFVFYTYQVDFDTMMANGMDKGIADMKARGMSDEDIQKALKNMNMFTSKEFVIGSSAIFFLIIYAIFALIAAAITKRTPPAM